MDARYFLTAETPSQDDYLRLRIVSGLTPKTAEGAAAGLPNTVFAVVVREAERVVAIGRIIGDGGLFFQIVDIAVDPAFQGRGLGKRIMAGLMAHVATLPKGAYVSLIADTPADRLYAQFGFVATAPRSLGMAYRVK